MLLEEYHTIDECRSYISAQSTRVRIPSAPELGVHPPAVTVSREAGARGRAIGKLLVDELREEDPKAEVPWALFDQNLVRQILDDHELPKEIAKFMPDDAVGELESTINEILGRHPSMWTLFEHTVDTIARLARSGHCVIVGRGGNMITKGFHNVLRVRLIGSLKRRIRHFAKVRSVSEKDAQHLIHIEDKARIRFLKQHFSCNIADPSNYDLVINTDHLSDADVVAILKKAIETKIS